MNTVVKVKVGLDDGSTHEIVMDFETGLFEVDGRPLDKTFSKNLPDYFDVEIDKILKCNNKTFEVLLDDYLTEDVEPEGSLTIGKIFDFYSNIVDNINMGFVFYKWNLDQFLSMLLILLKDLKFDWDEIYDRIETNSIIFLNSEQVQKLKEKLGVNDESEIVGYIFLHDDLSVGDEGYFGDVIDIYGENISDVLNENIVGPFLKKLLIEFINDDDTLSENEVDEQKEEIDNMTNLDVIQYFIDNYGLDELKEVLESMFEFFGYDVFALDFIHRIEGFMWGSDIDGNLVILL